MTKMARNRPRIPDTAEGIQINFCKNPLCLNYGRQASQMPQPRGLGAATRERDTYTVVGASGGRCNLYCKLCDETLPMKSNLAVYEELERMAEYLNPVPEASCPTVNCDNHRVVVSDRKAYYSFGKTKSGSQRYRCRLCDTTLSVGGPTFRQKRPEVNEQVMELLVNKMPLKRIMEVVGISASTLYGKIDFIHQRCLMFAATKERNLRELTIPRVYISVDRQDYLINWSEASDKRNIVLSALGSADNDTGYVFGCHLNYDPRYEAMAIERGAKELGDHDIPRPFRRYARYWLSSDYTESIKRNGQRKAAKKQLLLKVKTTYDAAWERDDIEVSDGKNGDEVLPFDGMQIHAEYTLYGHFFFLKRLLSHVGKFRFFLDQESGIRAACLAAFSQEVLKKTCDAFYVRINKDLTINEKRRLKAESDKEIAALRDSAPYLADLSDNALRHEIIKDRMKSLLGIGKWNDRWLVYPFPDMSEPEKAICWLTDLQDRSYDADHLANLYSKATLHGIDRFFMQARRRLSLLERPISTSSAEGRKWYGYGPYNPAVVGKLLDIFRVFYDFAEIGKDKKTPAMRLGLVPGPASIGEILN